MINKLEKIQASNESMSQLAGLPIPFTIEALRKDILFLYYQQIRTIGWMAGADAIWKLIDRKDNENESICFDPDTYPENIKFEYGDISETSFALAIEQMYQYAYLGIIDYSKEFMENESIHMWISAILSDLANSRVAGEWDSYGVNSYDAAKRCLEVAELANARLVLEGASDNFFSFADNGKDDDMVGIESLTVRQMALLSGMEEMSIRAAANPKRANPLQTYSEEGRTRVSVDTAKKWIISKGRYVPIAEAANFNEIEFSKRRFKSLSELTDVIEARLILVPQRGNADIKSQLIDERIFKELEFGQIELNAELLSLDKNKIHALAKALNFDQDLFSLRVRETLAYEELNKIDKELREITKH